VSGIPSIVLLIDNCRKPELITSSSLSDQKDGEAAEEMQLFYQDEEACSVRGRVETGMMRSHIQQAEVPRCGFLLFTLRADGTENPTAFPKFFQVQQIMVRLDCC
jgi:hypothetical protein